MPRAPTVSAGPAPEFASDYGPIPQNDRMKPPGTLIVGAGFAGSVMARELAEAGHHVHAIGSRPHIAGNAYDELDAHGVLVHRYGPHIFHTKAERIFKYLSRFTEWRAYEHRVRGVVSGVPYPFPINRDTLNRLYGLGLDEGSAAALFFAIGV